jgi:hypothetical protein
MPNHTASEPVPEKAEEPVDESAENMAKRFAALTARWKEETAIYSRVDKMANHPAYREIVAMGEKAVPLILADLEKNGGKWFMALRQLTGAHPVPKESAGKIREMEAAWIEWGRAQGYRW